ncbi:hypothetical protein [Actinosynnema mirum]|uniref:Uncharacterized protein n=1 Tax=Actinosynnema mirum (strain ATCC 29888 / DSM 43827 / JCM 3225 / NBRC 14064 / NCIMB 13271 / NRRL B-12336 / IMRU 3971 / 101) TaxID=446462 RepID=C6WBN8_ACTMD|nr:hypothetical protein [Actinosynnema mirum]ACU35606.1 hypothetical protein Amir_1657 [Actinosynnema mirum DSM 43827]
MDDHSRQAEWWRRVAESPEGARFAVLARDRGRAYDDLVLPLLAAEPSLAAALRASRGGNLWEAFGHRVLVINREHTLRGLSLFGFYDHSGTYEMHIVARTRLTAEGPVFCMREVTEEHAARIPVLDTASLQSVAVHRGRVTRQIAEELRGKIGARA